MVTMVTMTMMMMMVVVDFDIFSLLNEIFVREGLL